MLTTAQLQTLKAYIASVPAWAALPKTADSADFIARELNKAASPTFVVWRKSVPIGEVGKVISYVAWAAMTDANRARVTGFITLNPNEFDPARSDIRAFFADSFSGALGGAGEATRLALDAMYRRTATVAEN